MHVTLNNYNKYANETIFDRILVNFNGKKMNVSTFVSSIFMFDGLMSSVGNLF
jgi:hypothetical protein